MRFKAAYGVVRIVLDWW